MGYSTQYVHPNLFHFHPGLRRVPAGIALAAAALVAAACAAGDRDSTALSQSPLVNDTGSVNAHQYEAAILNQLNGAGSTADVDAALAFAESFFSTTLPSTTLTKAVKQQVTYYAGILAAYNQGDTGPGHCSEDRLSSTAP